MLIFVISDSIGETGTKVIQAATSQFPIDNLEIRRFPFVRDTYTIDKVFEDYQQENSNPANGMIAFTLVSPELRAYTLNKGKALNIVTMDILGPFMEQVARMLNLDPRLKPGLTHQMDQAYYKRVEAIEFAIKYDDGKDNSGLKEADVVLVGISRTSKTPLCMYLAYQAIKAANVPLVPETSVPQELFQLPRFKVIGLTIQPDVLHSIRVNRLKEMGLYEETHYSNMERILKELEYGQQIMKKLGCPVIDTSNKAMEETAGKIMQIMQRSV